MGKPLEPKILRRIFFFGGGRGGEGGGKKVFDEFLLISYFTLLN